MAKFYNVSINCLLFTHFPLVEESTMPWNIRFILPWFCDKSLFLWQKLLSLAKPIMWQKLFFCHSNFFLLLLSKYVSLTDTQAKTCILKDIFSLAELFVWRKLWHNFFFFCEVCFCHKKKFFCYSILFLWPNLVLFKIPFLGILYVISREGFLWEMEVFVISDTRDTHFVEPCPLPTLSHFFFCSIHLLSLSWQINFDMSQMK